ncbi:MAG: glycosyltransferase [Rikenellaceae bacterium]|jgi:glycosyltransferase involved in cell wall biosynthesis|nr:glycosyltransferase [Rikenellaceae bacterium]
MSDFTVSVIISTYNAPLYLRLSLQSLLEQTHMPDEVIIADDGSGLETKVVIDAFRDRCPVRVKHVWQEDTGFRKAAITNRAAAAAASDYLIVVDGDLLLHRHLVRDHCDLAAPGVFLSASRVPLPHCTTRRILSGSTKGVNLLHRLTFFNGWRFRCVMHWVSERYKQGPKYRYRTPKGCNMSMWRDDLISVNGYDEDFEGWGYEDTELAVRLRHTGLKMLNVKFGALVFHMWHGNASRAKGEKNRRRMLDSIEEGKLRCENGIDKYL